MPWSDISAGQQSVTATTGATTLITIPAGRLWTGQVGANCAVTNNAALASSAQARAVFSISGANAVPPAGTYLVVEAMAGANAALGLVGTDNSVFGVAQWMVLAPVGNTVLIQVTTTIAGSVGHCDSFAFGQLE